ncbi:hypothetical protein [Methylobacterium sp. Gmos1]
MSQRVISWFSCGAASAVATKLTLADAGTREVVVAYCETGSEHPSNHTFLKECERWFGKVVFPIRNLNFQDTWDVWESESYLAGNNGAPCTRELKVVPRLEFQRPSDIHVFGYTADKTDITRAKRLRENYPELKIVTPLIDRGINKEACIAMIERAGLPVPPMYMLGFQNNNCIPCSKATSPNYWALVRQRFPNEFDRMVALSRKLGVRLCRINGERAFIDEIPADWPTTNPIQPSCDFLCALAEQDMAEAH